MISASSGMFPGIGSSPRGFSGHWRLLFLLFTIRHSLLTLSAQAATWCAATSSPADGPGTAWTNAFHTIQGAVNVATNGDTVLVTNGHTWAQEE